MKIIKEVKFWIVAFSCIIYQTLKNRRWHMIFVDIETGQDKQGHPMRKKLIARRTCLGLELIWQEPLSFFSEEVEDEKS